MTIAHDSVDHQTIRIDFGKRLLGLLHYQNIHLDPVSKISAQPTNDL